MLHSGTSECIACRSNMQHCNAKYHFASRLRFLYTLCPFSFIFNFRLFGRSKEPLLKKRPSVVSTYY